MSNNYFQFKQFTIHQDRCAMKVCTDACVFGAWTNRKIRPFAINNILDIGCGTGLLSLMIAQNNKAKIDAIEINKDAAEQAISNVMASPWADQITIINNSLQAYKSEKKYDLIICNPPFYEDDLRSANEDKNAAKHDTSLKLEDLIAGIKNYLMGDGLAVVLLPFHRTTYFEEEAKKCSLFVKEKLLIRQTPRHDYFRSILLIQQNKVEKIEVNELVIQDEQRNYTADFEMLMKDYYLKLL